MTVPDNRTAASIAITARAADAVKTTAASHHSAHRNVGRHRLHVCKRGREATSIARRAIATAGVGSARRLGREVKPQQRKAGAASTAATTLPCSRGTIVTELRHTVATVATTIAVVTKQERRKRRDSSFSTLEQVLERLLRVDGGGTCDYVHCSSAACRCGAHSRRRRRPLCLC
jgi:hypothetical protein